MTTSELIVLLTTSLMERGDLMMEVRDGHGTLRDLDHAWAALRYTDRNTTEMTIALEGTDPDGKTRAYPSGSLLT